MANPKLLSVEVPSAQFKRLQSLAEQTGLTLNQLALEALRIYENGAKSGHSLAAALAATREDARKAGTDKLIMREINQEIAAARRERLAKKTPRAS